MKRFSGTQTKTVCCSSLSAPLQQLQSCVWDFVSLCRYQENGKTWFLNAVGIRSFNIFLASGKGLVGLYQINISNKDERQKIQTFFVLFVQRSHKVLFNVSLFSNIRSSVVYFEYRTFHQFIVGCWYCQSKQDC